MPHNRAVTCTGHMQYRCVCTHVWSPVTHTGLPSPIIPSSLLIFPSVRSHPYFAFSARIPLPAVGSDSAGKKKGGYVLFSPPLHVSKGGSNHCRSGADACGVISLQKPVEAAFSRLAPRGPRGILELRRHVFKLDMAFNYCVAV